MKPAQAQLQEIAEVRLGLTLRGTDAARHTASGTHQLVRIGDISDDGELGLGAPNLIRLEEASSHRFELRVGDVLLAARGTRMTATVFGGGYRAVAGSQFVVIRPRSGMLLPAYLRWFLNLPATQEDLNSRARGSYVRSLPLSSVGELEVPLPPIPRQHAIAELHELRLQEKRLMQTIADRRTLLVDHAILQSLRT